MEALTPRAALCAAQTVDYPARLGANGWRARRDGLTVHSSGAVYSGGDGCKAQYSGGPGCTTQASHCRGVCSGAPPAGTALRTGDTLTWAAGSDNQKAIDYEQRYPNDDDDIHARTSEMAGWELCFA